MFEPKTKTQLKRGALAFFFAPIIIPLFTLIISPLTGNFPTGGNLYKWSFMVIAIPYTYFMVAIVGIPIHLLLRYLSFRKWWQYAIVGLIIGFGFAEYAGRPSTLSLSIFGAYGLITSLTAWAIAVRPWKRDR